MLLKQKKKLQGKTPQSGVGGGLGGVGGGWLTSPGEGGSSGAPEGPPKNTYDMQPTRITQDEREPNLKKSSTETEYGVWKLLSCSFT